VVAMPRLPEWQAARPFSMHRTIVNDVPVLNRPREEADAQRNAAPLRRPEAPDSPARQAGRYGVERQRHAEKQRAQQQRDKSDAFREAAPAARRQRRSPPAHYAGRCEPTGGSLPRRFAHPSH